eukprot:NODE_3633_length_1316_cov_23.264878_g3179_i0.p1 GENE.NODE_3633_length_1316_cov_23.264878_g3179_i0~~NODE_3633_length_1316_cov_23.264878_g3179_i0.p1  ORF type:complete len:315 (+),score=46.74 NODE_3633_length_1316_cov_23.264878_g3179_i0:80-946(+)
MIPIIMIVIYLTFRFTKQKRVMQSVPNGNVTIVFTDIQNSTYLWSNYKEEMKQALAIHNRVIRQAIDHNNGYEIKTIGDSFMVAFKKVCNAADFCIEIQKTLLEQAWPPVLLQDDNCNFESIDGVVIWNGIRVRAGMNCGCPDVEYNSTIHKADYFGPMVNISSRIEGLATGGQTLISTEVYENLDSKVYKSMPYGTFFLKGAGNQIIYELTTIPMRTIKSKHEERSPPTKNLEEINVCISCMRPCTYCQRRKFKSSSMLNGLRRVSSPTCSSPNFQDVPLYGNMFSV